MFDLLKQDVKVGNKVKLYLVTGKEPEGVVLEIGENYILLEAEDGTKNRFFDKLIGGWDVVENDVPKSKSIRLSKICKMYEVDMDIFVELFTKYGLPIKQDPNFKVKLEDIEKIKTELEGLRNTPDTVQIESFIKKAIEEENHDEPLSDSMLWSLFNQKNGTNVKRKIIVQARKNLGFEYHYNRYPNEKKQDRIIEEVKTYKSFDELSDVYEKQQLETFLSPNAEINRYFFQFSNGSAKNDEFERILFKSEVVCDIELLKELGNFKKGDLIPVVCNFTKTAKGIFSYLIFKPCKIEELIKKTEDLIISKDKKRTISLLNYLNTQKIDTKIIIRLREMLNSIPGNENLTDNEEYGIDQNLSEKFDFNQIYDKARKLRLKKNFEEAEKLFKILVDNKYQIDSVAKDLADQYREQGRINEAISLIEHYITDFEKSLQANNFLYDLYVSTGNLEKAKDVLLNIINTPFDQTKKNEVRKRVKVYTRLGALLTKTGDEKNANKYIEEANILLNGNNIIQSTTAKNKRQKRDPKKFVVNNDIAISRLIYGVTPFINQALENCKYLGVPIAEVEKRNFTKKTLQELNNEIIENSGYGYNLPKSRAAFYLTKAKLMSDLDLSEDEDYYDTLATYCFSMARVAIIERSDLDYCIEWFINGFKLERIGDNITKQAWRFIQALLHFKAGSEIALSIDQKSLIVNLSNLIKKDSSIWNYILTLGLSSKLAINEILNSLSQFTEGNDQAIKYLILNNSYKTELSLIQNWDNYILKYSQKEQEIYSTVNNLLRRGNISDFVNYFNTINKQLLDNIFLPVDKLRFDQIIKMNQSAESFLSTFKFDDKEVYYADVENRYNLLFNEIREFPTNLSLSFLLQIASQTYNLSKAKYNEFVIATLPIIDLNIEGDCIINEIGDCDIQVSISNLPNCAPIDDISISVTDDEIANCFNSIESFSSTLRGGGEPIIGRFSLHFSDQTIKQGATDVNFAYKYRILTTGEEKSFEKTLSIVFYNSKNFIEVHNPYAEHAKSNIVENPEMFKGRSELINRIFDTIMNTKSKGYVLYGQKRSGKSSVLWHLENKFNTSSNAFAIYYSIGLSISQDNNVEANFYYRILTTIELKIRKLKSSGHNVPEVGRTILKDLMLNPPIVFYDRLNEIKNSFNENETWRDKKLVLIIDEFTYIYYQILKGTISQTFMQNWKAFIEDGGFSVVVSGQDTMKQFMLEFPNEFGMFKPERLTYLDKESAKELIDEPAWDKENNRSRYTRDSIDKIISLTACSPFYIQIICNELVRFMNQKKKPVLTPRDVEDVVFSLCKGQNSLTEFDFENLLSAGDKQLDKIKPDEAYEMLSEIAKLTKSLNFARREDISVYSVEIDNAILNDLIDRAVLEEESIITNRYKIQVQLFKDWLNYNN